MDEAFQAPKKRFLEALGVCVFSIMYPIDVPHMTFPEEVSACLLLLIIIVS